MSKYGKIYFDTESQKPSKSLYCFYRQAIQYTLMNTGAVFDLPEHTLYNVQSRYDQNWQGGAFISINVTE